MWLRILLSLVVVLLVAVMGLLVRIVFRQKLQYSRAVEDAVRRQALQSDLGDKVIWSRGESGHAGVNLSRRQLVPNALAGLAALVLFRLSARGVDVDALVTKVLPPRGRHDRSSTLLADAVMGQDHTDSHTDAPSSHIDVTEPCGPHVDTERPHGDSHVDFVPPPPHEDHNDHNDSLPA